MFTPITLQRDTTEAEGKFIESKIQMTYHEKEDIYTGKHNITHTMAFIEIKAMRIHTLNNITKLSH